MRVLFAEDSTRGQHRVSVDGEAVALDAATIPDDPVIERSAAEAGSSRSPPSRPARAVGTTTSAAPRVANRSGEASARPSHRSATSPAWPALGREQDIVPLRRLRILAELDRGRARALER